MTSRDHILQALRANRRPFEDAAPRPDKYLPVTQSAPDLVAQFITEVKARAATVHTPAHEEEAIQTVMDILGSDKTVIAWGNLPLPGLSEALTAQRINTVIPQARAEERFAVLRS